MQYTSRTGQETKGDLIHSRATPLATLTEIVTREIDILIHYKIIHKLLVHFTGNVCSATLHGNCDSVTVLFYLIIHKILMYCTDHVCAQCYLA